jgi:hypothetical protein
MAAPRGRGILRLMAAPLQRDQTAYPPAEVEVTVIPGPRGGSLEQRLPRIRVPAVVCGVVATVLALAALGAAFALRGGRRTSPRARDESAAPVAGARLPGAAGVAAAYRYPLDCLSVTISAYDPAYATARLDRASPCWRYGAWGVAVFRRVDGAWRQVRQTPSPSPSCRGVALPFGVSTKVAACRSAAPRPSTRLHGRRVT